MASITPGGNPNAANNMAALNQQRELNRNIANAQVTNQTTIGKTVNRTEAEVKSTTAPLTPPPQEKVTLSTTPKADEKTTTGQTTATTGGQAAEKTAETAEKPASKSAQALNTFTEALEDLRAGDAKDGKENFKGIVQEWVGIDPGQLPAGESGKEIALAATALKTAVAKLQAKMPNATPEQIREAAKTDPEIARWAAVADSAGNFLNEIKAEGAQQAGGTGPNNPNNPNAPGTAGAGGPPGGPPGPGGPEGPQPGPGQNPFRLNPEQQAQMFADNVKTMQSIMNIYQQMWAEVAKARAQRHQLILETANTINNMIMESHVNRMKSSENHRKAIMGVILETAK